MIKVVDRVPTYPNRIKITHADGSNEFVTWERADEPTVEGTPINKELFDSIGADIGLAENKTVYVSSAGSDTLGDGTVANPYATITKAQSVFPKNLNGYEAIINIAPGTYNEDVLIERTFGGLVILDGAVGVSVNIHSIRVFNGSSVQIRNIALTVTGSIYGNGITVDDASLVMLNDVTVSGASEVAVSATRNGFVCALGTLIANGTSNSVIYASNCASIYVALFRGNVTSGALVRAMNGAKVAYGTSNISASVTSVTAAGGRVYSGAQASVPSY